MATFGQLKQAVYDRLLGSGGTATSGDVTMVERWVNEACAEVCLRHLETFFKDPNQQAWWWLEASTNLVYTATASYTLSGATVNSASDIGHAIRVYDPFGVPLEMVNPDLFEDLYAGDTTTGTPTIATITGSVQTTTVNTPAQTIKVWPTPTTTTTGSLAYLRRWVDIATGADSSIPFIPARLHPLITDLVLARADRWQDSEMAQQIEARAVGGLGASIQI